MTTPEGGDLPAVGVVVLAYGPEPLLESCLESIRRSKGVHVELLVVDNGCSRTDLARVLDHAQARVVHPLSNLGFAAGCNVGVAALGEVETIALVNSDAVLDPNALRLLADALSGDVGIATASVRLAEHPTLVNSAGNPVHFTGVSWAGGMGEPAATHSQRRDVASASGATMAVRRALWEELGGFDGEYFTYVEDTELSLRCWLAGSRVVYVPDAIALHHYEFSRNQRKHYYLERNRLLLLLTVYETGTLLRLAPALLLWEACTVVGSVVQGWWPSKLRGWLWLLQNRRHVRARRATVQSGRRRGDAVLAPLLESRISPSGMDLPRGFSALNAVLAGYWRLAERRLS